MKKSIKVIIVLVIFFISLNSISASEVPNLGFGSNGMSCIEIVGENLSKVIKSIFTILRIGGAIIALVNGMIKLLPPLIEKDASALNKATKKCIRMAIVLAIIGIFPSIINFIGSIFKFDLSCIF